MIAQVCNNIPHCQDESPTSTNDINIILNGGRFTTSLPNKQVIYGVHQGTGEIIIKPNEVTITSSGGSSYGVYGRHEGTGNINIETSGSSITTSGDYAPGIFGIHDNTESTDNINIKTSGGSIITLGTGADGIVGQHNGTGNINIETSGGSITTKNNEANGIFGVRYSTGNVRISSNNGSITTEGTFASGIRGGHASTGDINIETSGGSITTSGSTGIGIFGYHQGQSGGNIDIETSGGSITTSGSTGIGIYGLHTGQGNIDIETSGGSITTSGNIGIGIYGRVLNNENDGDLNIIIKDGHTITTDGDNAHGIYLLNNGKGSSHATVGEDSIINANGVDAHGIRFGGISSDDGSIINTPPVGDDGYRQQSVRINGKVMGGTGNGAGVFMTGGGRVTIGPEGVLGALSGIAIHASGSDLDDEGTPMPPKLYVNIESTNGKPWERLQGRIINDNGETILEVNEVVLFDESRLDEGSLDAWALDGLYEVQFNPEGDFSEFDFSDEENWLSLYHPIVGVYEALPGAVRRIDAVPCRVATDQHFIGLCGGRGKYLPAQTEAGMSYTYDQGALHAHMMVPLNDRFSGWAGIRKVSGEAKITMAAGPGNLKVQGLGLYGGLQLVGDNEFYGQADFTGSRYDLELSAQGGSGPASSTTEGEALAIGIEAGRHFTLNDRTQLTGRGWLNRSEVSVEPFEDALTGRPVSAEDSQAKLGLGVLVERNIELAHETNHLVLRGGLGLEKIISADSHATVGEDSFQTVAKENRILLDLGGVFHRGATEIHGDVYAHGLGSDDTAFGLNLGMNWSF